MNHSLSNIIESGCCVGCGICSGYSDGALEMRFNRYGEYVPYDKSGSGLLTSSELNSYCPFSNGNIDENTLAEKVYSGINGIRHDDILGFYLDVFAGYDADEENRSKSTSGGIISWLLKKYLERGLVQRVAVVVESKEGCPFFKYGFIEDPREIDRSRKSKYYPVELSHIIDEIRTSDKKVAVVGLPCMIKGIRLAQENDPVLRDRIKLLVATFCGHLKTTRFTDYLLGECGVEHDDARNIEYRKPIDGAYAYDYEFAAASRSISGFTGSIRMLDVFGANWSMNLFMTRACNWCDDVTGETADISAGDAWVGEYPKDSKGTSILVVRNKDVSYILREARSKGELVLDNLEPGDVIESQSGAIRQRRSGLQFRLALNKKAGYIIEKRVEPSRKHLPLFYRLVQRLRLASQRRILEYLRRHEKLDNDALKKEMSKLVRIHEFLYSARSFKERYMRRLNRLFQKITGRKG